MTVSINKDKNIWKFSLYGFFKNLKFFEPFLYVFFLAIGFSYLKIGTLISIREIIKNVLEIPSGIFADNFGRKKTMQLCFILYISSFLLFFTGKTFLVMIIAMCLFGAGEAFRSGTHKAIIFSYLDRNGLVDKKVEVYGRTRSFSLIGSALSAVIGAYIVFIQSNYRLIFLLSVIPYIIDFLLINSYPAYLDGKKRPLNIQDILQAAKNSFHNLAALGKLRTGLINSGIYDGFFAVLKDFLQPILKVHILAVPLLISFGSQEKSLSLVLGFSYFIIYIISAISARNSYRIKRYFASETALNLIFLVTAMVLGLIGYLSWKKWVLAIMVLYIILYILFNLRRPIMLDYLSGIMDKKERATILSIESQLKTIVVIVLAPVFGYIADSWSLGLMYIFAFVLMLILYLIMSISNTVNKADHQREIVKKL